MATSCEWKNKYRTAIFETNRRALPKEIAEAEDAIIARASELLQKTGGDVDAEREELDEVLYTLQAFRKRAGQCGGMREGSRVTSSWFSGAPS